jgi:hypothetical protein
MASIKPTCETIYESPFQSGSRELMNEVVKEIAKKRPRSEHIVREYLGLIQQKRECTKRQLTIILPDTEEDRVLSVKLYRSESLDNQLCAK